MSQRLHAERMAQAERMDETLKRRADIAHAVLDEVRRMVEEGAASKIQVDEIVKGLGMQFDAIESRLITIETALGWTSREQGK